MLRVVNFLKLLSIILFLIILLLVYAYLPVMVKLEPESTGGLEIHRENFFYYTVGFFVVINVLLLAIQKLSENKIPTEGAKAWSRGAAFVINIYLTLLVGFIGVINNSAHLDASGFTYLNYFGPFLIFSWVVGLIYMLVKKL